MTVADRLMQLRDDEYAAFQRKLVPNINPDSIIGVRIPMLRAFAKEFAKESEALEFVANPKHDYYDENILHNLLICGMKNYDECLTAVEAFLPYIDNWAVCDVGAPKAFKHHEGELLPHIRKWIASDKIYTSRYGIGMLMRLYLDERFEPEYLELPAHIIPQDYYAKMMQAWFYATALAKQWDSTIGYVTERRLDEWVHRKTIQKACESYRITDEQKVYLKNFR